MKTTPTAEFLAAIVEHLAHPIFVKDRGLRFVLLNPAFLEMVGRRREEMLGKTDHDFFPREQADWFRAKDIEMFDTGELVQVDEESITIRDGSIRTLTTTKVPYRDEGGEVTHIVGIIKDITELKRAQDALRDANERLERSVAERTQELAAAHDELVRNERLTVLGQLAGGLAHQLRNPLAAIQNAASLLRHASDQDATLQALSIIDEEVHRADRTIGDLLDYAAIRPPLTQDVVVSELIEQAIDLEHPPEGVDIRVDADAQAMASVDPSQMLAALGNVIRNAVEAVEHRSNAVVIIHVEQHGSRVRITVGDSGDGVSPAAEHNLFDPLVTTKPLGIGLGLSIARSLVQNQGGEIRVGSSPLGGAAFIIDVPGPAQLAGASREGLPSDLTPA